MTNPRDPEPKLDDDTSSHSEDWRPSDDPRSPTRIASNEPSPPRERREPDEPGAAGAEHQKDRPSAGERT
jgi:hypothetical protein